MVSISSLHRYKSSNHHSLHSLLPPIYSTAEQNQPRPTNQNFTFSVPVSRRHANVLDVEKGVKIIDEAKGIPQIQNRTEKLRRRAVWVVERILRIEEIAKEVAEEADCSAALVDAFQNADYRTRQDAENALRHIDKMPNFSSIFPNTV